MKFYDESTENSEISEWLWIIYPFFLLLLGYTKAAVYYEGNALYKIGVALGGAVILSIIPLIVFLFQRLLIKKKYSKLKTVLMFYGISFAVFVFNFFT